MSLIDPDTDLGRQEVSYRGGIRSASLAILDRFHLTRTNVSFATRDLTDYIRSHIPCSASRRRKMVTAVLSAGVRNGWLEHVSTGYWNFTERADTAFCPKESTVT